MVLVTDVRPARRARSAPLLAGALLLTMAASARAAEPAAAPLPGWQHINCTCRANGTSYHIGDRVCLSTPTGRRIAECRMSQNVTNWAVQSEGCDVSAALARSVAADAS
jgi:hypothetical protein